MPSEPKKNRKYRLTRDFGATDEGLAAKKRWSLDAEMLVFLGCTDGKIGRMF